MNAGSSRSFLRGANLVSFVPAVSDENRADILDVLLLAELSASQRYNRVSQWAQWVEAYRGVLSSLGLAGRGSLLQSPVKVSNEKGFRRETSRLIQTISPPQLAKVAQSGLDIMFSSAHARLFFSSWFNFKSARSDSFQIVPCHQTEAGEINIAVCGLQMITRTRPKRPIFFRPVLPAWPFAYEMTVTLRGGGFVFNAKAYEQHRQQVRRQLQARADKAIQLIEL